MPFSKKMIDRLIEIATAEKCLSLFTSPIGKMVTILKSYGFTDNMRTLVGGKKYRYKRRKTKRANNRCKTTRRYKQINQGYK